MTKPRKRSKKYGSSNVIDKLWHSWSIYGDRRLTDRTEVARAKSELARVYRAMALTIAAMGGPGGFATFARRALHDPDVSADVKAKLLTVVMSMASLSTAEIERAAADQVSNLTDEELAAEINEAMFKARRAKAHSPERIKDFVEAKRAQARESTPR